MRCWRHIWCFYKHSIYVCYKVLQIFTPLSPWTTLLLILTTRTHNYIHARKEYTHSYRVIIPFLERLAARQLACPSQRLLLFPAGSRRSGAVPKLFYHRPWRSLSWVFSETTSSEQLKTRVGSGDHVTLESQRYKKFTRGNVILLFIILKGSFTP